MKDLNDKLENMIKGVLGIFRSEAIIIFFVSFLVFINTSPVTSPSDTVPNLFLPLNIIRGKGFYLDKLYPFFMQAAPVGAEDGLPYYLSKPKDHYIADYPVLTGIMGVPVYLVPVLVNNITLDNASVLVKEVPKLGKLSASFYTALSAAVLFLALKKLTTKKKALVLTAIYAFCSSTFSVTSQAMWQHGVSQLFWCLALYFIILFDVLPARPVCRQGKMGISKEKDYLYGFRIKPGMTMVGLFLGLAVAARFPNLVAVIPIFVYLFIRSKKDFLSALIGFTTPILVLALYNWHFFGSPLVGGYEKGTDKTFTNNILVGITGLLIAPSKGLFVYSPIFLLSLWGIVKAWARPLKKDLLYKFLSLSVACYLLLVSSWSQWSGGWSFGPRMMVDMVPILVILMVPVVNFKAFRSLWVVGIVGILGVYSFLVQLYGLALAMKLEWYVQIGGDPANLFSWQYWELAWYWQKAGGLLPAGQLVLAEIFNVLSRSLKWGIIIGVIYLILASLNPKNKQN